VGNPKENLYYSGDEDDDIFAPKTTDNNDKIAHTLDGSKCPCGSVHNLRLPPDVPPEIIEKLSEYLDKLPDQTIDIIISAENSLGTKLMHDFMHFTEEVDSANKNAPFFRAVAETVDELAGGNKLGPLIKFYEAEQTVISSHVVKKALEGLKKKLAKDPELESDIAKKPIVEALDKILAAIHLRMDLAIQRYKEIGEETGHTTDLDIIETGVYGEEASYFASRLVQIPLLSLLQTEEDEEDPEQTHEENTEETSS